MGTLFKVILAIIAFFVAAAAAILLAFYYSPGLQKKVALGVLQSGFGEESRLDHVSFRLGSLQLRGLHISSGEESLDLEELDARFDFWSLNDEVPEIEAVVIRGLDLDIAAQGGASLAKKFESAEGREVSKPAAAETSAEFPGVPVRIGTIDLDGRVKLPGEREIKAAFQLRDLAPGATAPVEARIFIAAHAPGGPYQDAELILKGSLRQSPTGSLDRSEGEFIVRLRDAPEADWVETRTRTLFEGDPQSFSLSIEGVDLAALSRLSIFNLSRPMASGNLDFQLQGRTGEPTVVEGNLSVTDLRPEGYPDARYTVVIEPEIESRDSSKRIKVSAPIRLSGPTTVTNATLAADLDASDEEMLRFDATVQADVFNADDWQPLLSILPREEGPDPAQERDPAPDPRPAWAGLDGNLLVELGRLVAAGNVLTDLSLNAVVENGERITLQTAAKSNRTPITASGSLAFLPDRPDTPYRLDGGFRVESLDVTPFLKPPQSGQPAMLEGIFDVAGDFQSTAPNPAFIPDFLTGSLQLNSAGAGIFRPLGENTSMAQGVSGLLGAFTGSVKELGWVQMVVDQLEEIPYRQMTFKLSRDENLDLVLKDLDLVSRETRIRGGGTIRYQEGVDLLSLPMDLQFQLFAKGRLAEALRTGGQLRSSQPDDLGFLPGPPLPVRGSLAQPESMLMNLLMEGGSQLLPGLLRGK